MGIKQQIETADDYVKMALQASINQFLAKDFVLVLLDASEMSICHRLAVYLESWFTTFSVDCEYNRLEFETKSGADGSWFRPDIVVHERTTKNTNLLVVDAKCSTNQVGAKESEDLLTMTGDHDFEYQLGVFVIFHTQRAELTDPDHPRITGYWRNSAKGKHDDFEFLLKLSHEQLAELAKRPARWA